MVNRRGQAGSSMDHDRQGRRMLEELKAEVEWPGRAGIAWPTLGLAYVLLAALAYLLFPFQPGLTPITLKEGEIARTDIVAEFEFPIMKRAGELDAERHAARQAAPPVFRRDEAAVEQARLRCRELFRELNQAMLLAELPTADPFGLAGGRFEPGRLLQETRLGRELAPRDAAALTALESVRARESLEAAVVEALESFWARGVINLDKSAPELAGRKGGVIMVIRVRDAEPASSTIPLEEVYGFAQAVEALGRMASEAYPAPEDDDLRKLFAAAARLCLAANYRYDDAETMHNRERAAESVPVHKGTVLENELIVGRNVRVDAAAADKLVSHEAARMERVSRPGAFRVKALGYILLLALLFALPFLYMLAFARDILRQRRLIALYAVALSVFLLNLAAVRVLGQDVVWLRELSVEFLALTPLYAMILGVLIDRGAALAGLTVMGLIMAVLTPFGAFSMVAALAGGAAAIISSKRIRLRRAFALKTILWIAASYCAVSLAQDLLADSIGPGLAHNLLLGFGNGFLSTILFMGLLPLFESMFRITTDLTLLELSDLNHPLLRRLAVEAPGTFHHTMVVSSMAESGAEAVGANGLLARVGAYFHDIGKIATPEYFVENQGAHNPHDELAPHESADKIRHHVVEGVRLARAHGLPMDVIEFIPMHHGDNVMIYFYEKARTRDPDADMDAFRHLGPKPVSKEACIMQLADTVESSTRTLDDPTPDELRGFIDNLVSKKIVAGDLDRCALSMGEIKRVIDAFMPILLARGHHRIRYPGQDKPVKI